MFFPGSSRILSANQRQICFSDSQRFHGTSQLALAITRHVVGVAVAEAEAEPVPVEATAIMPRFPFFALLNLL